MKINTKITILTKESVWTVLEVQIRFEFLDVKHFKYQTIKFALALSHNLEMDLIQKITPTRCASWKYVAIVDILCSVTR